MVEKLVKRRGPKTVNTLRSRTNLAALNTMTVGAF